MRSLLTAVEARDESLQARRRLGLQNMLEQLDRPHGLKVLGIQLRDLSEDNVKHIAGRANVPK